MNIKENCNCEQALEYKRALKDIFHIVGQATTEGRMALNVGLTIQDKITSALKGENVSKKN